MNNYGLVIVGSNDKSNVPLNMSTLIKVEDAQTTKLTSVIREYYGVLSIQFCMKGI